ncbi:unnamed protein product [Protopolystoma xenopodis]|uniref:Uncharacterized protein n=1 Tax=Protopolystoma xenopodis TaxID=117903 RepID=A0A3S5BTI9_9PLAT|nr:unnamed protein product [Protopolystoma xenopodis]
MLVHSEGRLYLWPLLLAHPASNLLLLWLIRAILEVMLPTGESSTTNPIIQPNCSIHCVEDWPGSSSSSSGGSGSGTASFLQLLHVGLACQRVRPTNKKPVTKPTVVTEQDEHTHQEVTAGDAVNVVKKRKLAKVKKKSGGRRSKRHHKRRHQRHRHKFSSHSARKSGISLEEALLVLAFYKTVGSTFMGKHLLLALKGVFPQLWYGLLSQEASRAVPTKYK